MSTLTFGWEERLLKKATASIKHSIYPRISVEPAHLKKAYRLCTEITRDHSRTFFLASGLLAPEARRSARALYAFCRISDDIVDRAGSDPLTALRKWRAESLAGQHQPASPAALAWADTQARHRIPHHYAEQLLEGVAQDLTVRRYRSFEDLVVYCYGVASTVGLMTMHIIGFESEEAVPYAIKLAVALQLTNILRDVQEDWDNGRLYLPEDELHAFGLSEEDIAAGAVDPRWRRFMRFQIARARQLYREALPGIALLNSHGRFAITAAAELYQAILTDIEDHDYDVFSRRAHITGREKILRIPGIWRRARVGHAGSQDR